MHSNTHISNSVPIPHFCNTAKVCGELHNPDCGSVRTNGSMEWDKADYTCEQSFVLVGDSSRHCVRNDDGELEWSGQEPYCCK